MEELLKQLAALSETSQAKNISIISGWFIASIVGPAPG